MSICSCCCSCCSCLAFAVVLLLLLTLVMMLSLLVLQAEIVFRTPPRGGNPSKARTIWEATRHCLHLMGLKKPQVCMVRFYHGYVMPLRLLRYPSVLPSLEHAAGSVLMAFGFADNPLSAFCYYPQLVPLPPWCLICQILPAWKSPSHLPLMYVAQQNSISVHSSGQPWLSLYCSCTAVGV